MLCRQDALTRITKAIRREDALQTESRILIFGIPISSLAKQDHVGDVLIPSVYCLQEHAMPTGRPDDYAYTEHGYRREERITSVSRLPPLQQAT